MLEGDERRHVNASIQTAPFDLFSTFSPLG